MKELALIVAVIGFSYFGVLFVLAFISFVVDHLTKDESQRYEEYWNKRDSDNKQ